MALHFSLIALQLKHHHHFFCLALTSLKILLGVGIGRNLIYYWIKKAKNNQSRPGHNLEILYDDEKTGLHKRIKELEQERDILKKALGIFSR